jgi:hypothetical protein
MKKYIAFVFVALIFSCFVSVASAQKVKHPTLKFGMDFGAVSGGFSMGYNYVNNGGLYKSGTNYRSGLPLGGTVQLSEPAGWTTEFRFRHQSIGNPIFWFKQVNAGTFYQDGQSSNAVEQYGGNFSALDIIQQIPVMRHKTVKHGFAINAVAGLTNVRVTTHNVTDIFTPSSSHDDATFAQIFWGPEGGGRFSYTAKRIEVATEATFGYLHENGTYKDLQSDYSSTGVLSYPPYSISATTWSQEVNWRSTLTVTTTSHLALTLKYEKRIINSANGQYLFTETPNGSTSSEFFGSNALMAGFVFRP